jgi:predicted ribosome quality control (RQC) complex YloA/Tae2 family protein
LAKSGSFQYIVDNIMLTNYHTLGYVASTLHTALQGLRINQIFTQNANEMVLSFGAEHPSLIFSCRPDLNIAYLHDRFARARSNSTDVLHDAHGNAVTGIAIHPADRIISLSLASKNRIALQFFGAQSNAVLINSTNIITDAFRKPRQVTGKVYTDRPGHLVYDPVGLPATLRSAGTMQITQSLRNLYPSLGSTLTRELLYRSAIEPATMTAALPEESLTLLSQKFQELLNELGTPRPRVYLDTAEVPSCFSLIDLHHLNNPHVRQFDDLHAALRFYCSRRLAGGDLATTLSSLRTSLRHQQEKLQRLLKALEEDAREADRAHEYEHFGTLLMAHLPEIHKGDVSFTVDGSSIKLEPGLSPVQNSQRYFTKAKRSKAAAGEKEERLRSARERSALASHLLEKLELVYSREDVEMFFAQHRADLEIFGLSPGAGERTPFPFRVFKVDGGFEVWAGKGSENNDLLTLRHARPNDLWFHARGCSGSHVLLKLSSGKGEPGRKAKEQAAAIAAYYSKMKTSSLVPVAMTERKYVRKPKGAPPGTVLIERETVLLVEPALPEEAP